MTAVSEHMSSELLAVSPETTVGDAAQRMAARNVGTVLVMDGDRLAGILTERDVLRAVGGGWDPAQPVSARMTPDPETIDSTDSTEHAAVLMIHGGFRHLPVLEDGRVVGILSIRDLVRVTIADAAPRGA